MQLRKKSFVWLLLQALILFRSTCAPTYKLRALSEIIIIMIINIVIFSPSKKRLCYRGDPVAYIVAHKWGKDKCRK